MQDHSPAPPVDLNAVARRIADRAGTPTSVADIERVISALLTSSDFWEVVNLAGRPVGQVAETLIALAGEDLAQKGGAIALTPAGTSVGWQRGLTPRKRFRCPHCAGRGLALDVFRRAQTRWEKVRTALDEDGADERLSLDGALGMVAFLADRGDLLGKSILVLGDPSLVGVALAVSGFPRQVVVLDEDTERAWRLGEVVKQERIALEIRSLAADAPLPADLTGGFTTLVLGSDHDARDTMAQVRRGLAGLRGPGCGVVYGLSSARVSLLEQANVERDLLTLAPIVLTDVLREALEYERHPDTQARQPNFAPPPAPPQGPWYRSAIIRWETLPGFEPTSVQERP